MIVLIVIMWRVILGWLGYHNRYILLFGSYTISSTKYLSTESGATPSTYYWLAQLPRMVHDISWLTQILRVVHIINWLEYHVWCGIFIYPLIRIWLSTIYWLNWMPQVVHVWLFTCVRSTSEHNFTLHNIYVKCWSMNAQNFVFKCLKRLMWKTS